MWRWLVGVVSAILLGWGFWYLGTISPVPASLAEYAQPESGKAVIAWINHPQTNETSLFVKGTLTTWHEGEASWYRWLKSPSRWLHTRLDRATGVGELHRIIGRLILMRKHADADKAGTASKVFLDEEYRWKEQLDKEGTEYKETLRQAIYLSYWLFADIDDQHGAYRIKQQLEDWRLRLARDETESLAVRLLSLNSRVQESAQAYAQGRFEEAELAASVGVQGLDNVAHDMDQLRPYWPEDTANMFGETWSRMRAQTSQLRERIAEAGLDQEVPALPDITAASTTDLGAVTGTDALPSTTSTTPTPPVATSTASTVRRISVIPSSTSLSFGQTISLRAYAINDDGARNDVTPRCQFSVAPEGFGQIDKQLFSALANAGSAVITARCQLEDQFYAGSVTVEVRF